MVPKGRGGKRGKERDDVDMTFSTSLQLCQRKVTSPSTWPALPSPLPFFSSPFLLPCPLFLGKGYASRKITHPSFFPTPLFVPAVILPLLPFTTQFAFLFWLMALNSSFVTSYIRIQTHGHGLWGRRLNHMFAVLASVKG